MNAAKKIVDALLIGEESHLERQVNVRPETALRLDRTVDRMHPGMKGSITLGIGTTTYTRDESGKWTRTERKRNQAYWSKPQYFMIYGEGIHSSYVAVKMPRTLKAALYRRAVMQIYKEASGISWKNSQGKGVDGFDQAMYDKRSQDNKAPTYEINPDGSWKRTNRIKESEVGELPYGDTVPLGDWEGRLVYHGCSQQAADSIMQGIEVPPTGGYFGNAFYVADDAKLAKSNYADMAGEEEGGAAVLEFTVKLGAHILDLRSEEGFGEWMRVSNRGNNISLPDFHLRMVRQGVDGVFDRSVGGLAVYNPEILDLKGLWRGR